MTDTRTRRTSDGSDGRDRRRTGSRTGGEHGADSRAPSRRSLIGWGGAGLALGAAAAGGAVAMTRNGDDAEPTAAAAGAAVAFHGTHQAGIATPCRTGCTSPRST